LGREALKRIRKEGASKTGLSAINSEDLRGAHTFSTDSDTIYAQVPNTTQPNHLLDFFVVKARHGKKTFPNGHLKATLEVMPEFSLIKSPEVFEVIANDNDPILNKIMEGEQSGPGSVVFDNTEDEFDNF